MGRFAAAVVVLGLLAAGCSNDGRELAEPDPDLTAVPVPTTAPSVVAGAEEPPTEEVGEGGFAISSGRITPGQAIPPRFTCDGEDVSPPLAFTNVPDAAAQIAVVVTDLDAPGFVHWAIRGLRPSAPDLEAGEVPPQAVESTNSFGVTNYRGPCPPTGQEHRYVFTAYALDANVVELPVNEEGVVDVGAIPAITTASFLGRFKAG